MQQTNILPFPGAQNLKTNLREHAEQACRQPLRGHIAAVTTRTEWHYPGKVISLGNGVLMGLTYQQQDGHWEPVFTFRYNGSRLANLLMVDNQLDLRTSTGHIITRLIQQFNKTTGRPTRTKIEIARVPLGMAQ